MAPPGDEDEQSSAGFPSFQYTKKALVDHGNSEGKNVVVNGLNMNGDTRNHHAGVPPLHSCGSSLSDTMAVHSGCPPRPLVYYLARASYPAPAATPSCARLH